jgi:hypothetical protein
MDINGRADNGISHESWTYDDLWLRQSSNCLSSFSFHGRPCTWPWATLSPYMTKRHKSTWGFPKIGVPQQWMVYNGKTYQNGWFRGTTILGNLHIMYCGVLQTCMVFVCSGRNGTIFLGRLVPHFGAVAIWGILLNVHPTLYPLVI